MKKIFGLIVLSALLIAAPAFADTYVNIPHPTAVWDSTTASLYALGIPGQGQTGLTIIPSSATANAWSGTNNFTGTFEINGVAQAFPTSGLLVGTTDTQTLANKTLATLTIGSATLATTTVALTNGAGSGAGTLTNAPAAGNPTKWIPINDNGTMRYIPAW